MKRVAVLSMLVMWATGCATGPGPKEVMGKYLDAYGKGNYEEAYPLLSSSDKAAKSLEIGFATLQRKLSSYRRTSVKPLP